MNPYERRIKKLGVMLYKWLLEMKLMHMGYIWDLGATQRSHDKYLVLKIISLLSSQFLRKEIDITCINYIS